MAEKDQSDGNYREGNEAAQQLQNLYIMVKKETQHHRVLSLRYITLSYGSNTQFFILKNIHSCFLNYLRIDVDLMSLQHKQKRTFKLLQSLQHIFNQRLKAASHTQSRFNPRLLQQTQRYQIHGWEK